MPSRLPAPTGYSLDLGAELVADLHPDGRLTIAAGDGRAADLDPAQVEALAELLRLGAGLRSQARRRAARAAYGARYGQE